MNSKRHPFSSSDYKAVERSVSRRGGGRTQRTAEGDEVMRLAEESPGDCRAGVFFTDLGWIIGG